jgi:hypothetical protein
VRRGKWRRRKGRRGQGSKDEDKIEESSKIRRLTTG